MIEDFTDWESLKPWNPKNHTGIEGVDAGEVESFLDAIGRGNSRRDEEMAVVIVDPERGFGRPMFAVSGAPVHAVAERLRAGEPMSSVAHDFELTDTEIDACLDMFGLSSSESTNEDTGTPGETDEIERLRAQAKLAHAILSSEQLAWLVVGSNHPEAQWAGIKPAVFSYWEKYGNYFRPAGGDLSKEADEAQKVNDE